MNGFINLYKPTNMTSNDAVVKARGILKAALGERPKVGHLGTLDPLATGVLPIAVGKATRLFDAFLKKKKTYDATFVFGKETDTLDGAGRIVAESDAEIDFSRLQAVANGLVGEIEQLPPAYSAKSVDGKRAYDLAREGKAVPLTPKKVTVYSIKITDISEEIKECRAQIVCGGGTYIRAIARDIAHGLGTVGYMSSLTRTSSGPFEIAEAVSFENFEKQPLKFILPVEFALADMPSYELADDEAKLALNGMKIKADPSRLKGEGDVCAVKLCGKIVATGVVKDGYLSLAVRLV